MLKPILREVAHDAISSILIGEIVEDMVYQEASLAEEETIK